MTAKHKPSAKKPAKITVALVLTADDVELLASHQAAHPTIESQSAAARDLFRIARAAIAARAAD